jgi:O-antigen ligase
LSLAFLLVQIVVGTGFTFYPELNPNTYLDLGSGALRYPGFFQDPQKYAQYLSMVGFLFLMNKESSPSPGIKNILIFSLIIIAILLTGGRAAFFGLALGFLIVLFARKGKYWLVFILVCLIGYLISIRYQEYFSILNRSDDLKSSFEVRNDIWNENLQIFLENPLLGIGIGNHHNYIVNHTPGGYYLIDNEIVYYGTESGYLQILVEYGIFGFILAFLFIVMPIINSIRSYLDTHNSNIILLIASVISWLTAFFTINSLSDKRILIVLVTLICLLIISKTSSKSIHA